MTTNAPLSPSGLKGDFKLPMPPPPLSHTRSAEGAAGDLPTTPTTPRSGANAFFSPYATPQGSPSKSTLPPGARDLPNIFDNALRLEPPSPTKAGTGSPTRGQLGVGSPNKVGKPLAPTSPKNEPAFHPHDATKLPGSPLREGQENTPPGGRPLKEYPSSPTHAAVARQEQYQPSWMSSRMRYNPMQALTPEEKEKLSLPKVKRLANVTQIYFLDHYFDLLNYVRQREARTKQFHECFPDPGPNPDYDGAKAKWLGRERANLRKRRTRLRQGDFQILTQVGQGGYGQVYLAQKKDTKEVCALKVMSKKLLFKLDEVRHILTERDILTAAKSEWLVKLLYAFQDDSSIYLAMEYVPGGDFRTLLNNTGVLHNRHARFYIAEMFMCVDTLHQLGYIHRDLKPENFLIDGQGHVKLTDFGLAAGMLSPVKLESMRIKLEAVGNVSVPFGRAPVEQRSASERREGYRSLRQREGLSYAKSIVGSPDYMAPEVLHGETYDFSVDYWSLGCMLYEALAGYPPFAGDTVDETWSNLRHWRQVFVQPDFADQNYYLSPRTWDLITRLVADKRQRFGGLGEIKAHAYFAEVDFAHLREQKAPFVPELDSETDAGYFDDFSNEADMAKYKEVHDKQAALETMADRDEKMGKGMFVGFTFRHRKPQVDGQDSPRKTIITDGNFGTIL